MSKHLDNLMHLYFDNELDNTRRKEVEIHLSGCEECSSKLADLKQLSSLLQDEPRVAQKSNEKQFVARVIAQLPAEIKEHWWVGIGKAVYAIIPALLFIAILFIRTTTYTNILLTSAEILGIGGDEISTLISDPRIVEVNSPIELSGLEQINTGRSLWESIGSINIYGIDIINAFVLPLLIGLLAVSWMIGWWVDQDKKQTVKIKI